VTLVGTQTCDDPVALNIVCVANGDPAVARAFRVLVPRTTARTSRSNAESNAFAFESNRPSP